MIRDVTDYCYVKMQFQFLKEKNHHSLWTYRKLLHTIEKKMNALLIKINIPTTFF